MTFAEQLFRSYSALQYLEFFGRIAAAAFCGAVIGFERSKRMKEAGIRTHVIVCCAAALIMVLSKYAFADLMTENGIRGADPARLAAQVVSGVSFLGAGIIFRNGNSIRGLTTAAGMWATAAIGLTFGSGMYLLGIVVTFLIALVQILMHHFTFGVDSMVVGKLHCVVGSSEDFRKAMEDYISEKKMQILGIKIGYNGDGTSEYSLTLRMGHDISIHDFADFLTSLGDVRSISFEQNI